MLFGLDFTSKFASLQTKETLKIIFFLCCHLKRGEVACIVSLLGHR